MGKVISVSPGLIILNFAKIWSGQTPDDHSTLTSRRFLIICSRRHFHIQDLLPVSSQNMWASSLKLLDQGWQQVGCCNRNQSVAVSLVKSNSRDNDSCTVGNSAAVLVAKRADRG